MSLTIGLVDGLLANVGLIENLNKTVIKHMGIFTIGNEQYTIIDGKFINIKTREVAVVIQEEKGLGWVERYKHYANNPARFVFSPILVLEYMKYTVKHYNATIYQFICSFPHKTQKMIELLDLAFTDKIDEYEFGLSVKDLMLSNMTFLEIKWIPMNIRFNVATQGRSGGEYIDVFANIRPFSKLSIFLRKKVMFDDRTYILVNDYFVFSRDMKYVACLLDRSGAASRSCRRNSPDQTLFNKNIIQIQLALPDLIKGYGYKNSLYWARVCEDFTVRCDSENIESVWYASDFIYHTYF